MPQQGLDAAVVKIAPSGDNFAVRWQRQAHVEDGIWLLVGQYEVEKVHQIPLWNDKNFLSSLKLLVN
jgi:hypothetical protein